MMKLNNIESLISLGKWNKQTYVNMSIYSEVSTLAMSLRILGCFHQFPFPHIPCASVFRCSLAVPLYVPTIEIWNMLGTTCTACCSLSMHFMDPCSETPIFYRLGKSPPTMAIPSQTSLTPMQGMSTTQSSDCSFIIINFNCKTRLIVY